MGGGLIEKWVVPWSSLEPTLEYSGATRLGIWVRDGIVSYDVRVHGKFAEKVRHT